MLNRSWTSIGLVSILAAMACNSGSLQEDRHPTGSQSLAPSSDYSRVYVANTDNGSISIASLTGGVVDRVDVGADPVRVARAGDRVFVTLRAEGAVVVMRETSGGLEVEDRVELGAEPYGVVADENGTSVFVALGLANQVVELDPQSLEVLERYSVPGQPRWLALHPSGKALYVGSAYGGTWSHVDLVDGTVDTHELPQRIRFAFNGIPEDVIMTPRVTGDLSVSPDGDFLVIPGLYLDNTTPVGDPGGDSVSMGGGYASTPGGIGRTNPGVIIVGTGSGGDPELARTRTVFASATRMAGDGDFDEMDFETVRSYVSSTSVSPDGMVVLAAMEGSEAILAVPMHVKQERNRFDNGMGGEFEFVSQVAVATDIGPRGMVFLDRDTAVVDTWLDHAVAAVPFRDTQEALRSMIVEDFGFMDEMTMLSTADAVEVAPPVLSAEAEHGRKKFYRATDRSMAAHSGGISCATCHMDGRNDGITWTFEGDRQLQTPSLAGPVGLTAPVTWFSDVPSVATEVRLTSKGRMGGTGATIPESFDVADFIEQTPYPKLGIGDEAAVARGKDLFEGSAECATCHAGELLTDATPYDMFGVERVRTPTLRGLVATAPYLHDGRAATIEALVEVAELGGMGKVNHLSPEQKADLVAYLKSL